MAFCGILSAWIRLRGIRGIFHCIAKGEHDEASTKYHENGIYYCTEAECCDIIYPVILYLCFGGLRRMTYSYNRLWKMLIDKSMTKTEMRKLAGISTNVLAKMGKDEPVAMDSLAKIATALQCGLDDIVEIRKDGE